jgi:hypothetical protein
VGFLSNCRNGQQRHITGAVERINSKLILLDGGGLNDSAPQYTAMYCGGFQNKSFEL